MSLPRNTLFSLTLCLSILPGTHAAESVTTAGPLSEAWRVEKPDQDSPVLSARLNGEASHGNKTTPAMLQISCYRSPLRPVIALLTSTDELGFDPGAYEGPDAKSNGPASLAIGTLAPRNYLVNGVYTQAFPQKDDLVFNFNMSADRQALRYWTSKAARGLLLTMTVPSTVKGDQPLTARFVFPQDDSALRKIVRLLHGSIRMSRSAISDKQSIHIPGHLQFRPT